MTKEEIKLYLKSFLSKEAENYQSLCDNIDSLPESELLYSYEYINTIEKAGGNGTVKLINIKKDNVVFIRVESFCQFKLV